MTPVIGLLVSDKHRQSHTLVTQLRFAFQSRPQNYMCSSGAFKCDLRKIFEQLNVEKLLSNNCVWQNELFESRELQTVSIRCGKTCCVILLATE